MGIRSRIGEALVEAVRSLGVEGPLPDLELGRATGAGHGDYASPAGLKLARVLRQAPPQIAARIADLLKSHGYIVDIIPTAVPQGYLADAFVALHLDGDGTGENSGYKLAHGSRRGPYEQQLLDDISQEYGAATGLPLDYRITSAMRGYYGFSWQRYRSATSPFTPSVILEMGFLSNDGDRALAMDHPDLLAIGIANGIERFLSEVPSTELFGKDLLLPPTRAAFRTPSPSATP